MKSRTKHCLRAISLILTLILLVAVIPREAHAETYRNLYVRDGTIYGRGGIPIGLHSVGGYNAQCIEPEKDWPDSGIWMYASDDASPLVVNGSTVTGNLAMAALQVYDPLNSEDTYTRSLSSVVVRYISKSSPVITWDSVNQQVQITADSDPEGFLDNNYAGGFSQFKADVAREDSELSSAMRQRLTYTPLEFDSTSKTLQFADESGAYGSADFRITNDPNGTLDYLIRPDVRTGFDTLIEENLSVVSGNAKILFSTDVYDGEKRLHATVTREALDTLFTKSGNTYTYTTGPLELTAELPTTYEENVGYITREGYKVYSTGTPNAAGNSVQKLLVLDDPFGRWSTNIEIPALTLTYTEETPPVENGELTIKKLFLDKGTFVNLPDIRFDITGPNGYSAAGYTDENGEIKLSDLEPGSYTITENGDWSKYAYVSPYTADIAPGSKMTVQFKNYLNTTTGLIIEKWLEDGSDRTRQPGVRFVITGPSGYSSSEYTDEKGEIWLADLEPGEYTVTEDADWTMYEKIDARRIIIGENQLAGMEFVNHKAGQLTIHKTSDDGSYAGVRFKVEGPAGTGYYNTGPDGYIRLTNLRTGSYTVTEMGDWSKYRETGPKTAEVEQGKETEVGFHNELIIDKGTITVIKSSEDGIIANKKFAVYEKEPDGKKGETVAEDTTDIDGKIVFHDIPFGTYICEEVSEAQYKKLAAELTLSSESPDYNVTFTANNREIRGILNVQKISSVQGRVPDGNTTFEGIEFTLYANGDNVTVHYTSGPVTYSKGEEIMKLVTDGTGHAGTSAILGYGKYAVRETDTGVTGYVPDPDWEYEFEVSALEYDSMDAEGNVVYSAVKPNDPVLKPIAVQKIDGLLERSEPFPGASFEGAVFRITNQSVNPVVINGTKYPSGATVMTVETDATGYAETEAVFPYGAYGIREMAAPAGYLLNEDEIIITIDGNGGHLSIDGEDVTSGLLDLIIESSETKLTATYTAAPKDGTKTMEEMTVGDTVVLTAEIDNEDLFSDIMCFWEYSEDGTEWTTAKGGEDRTFEILLSEENLALQWRLRVTAGTGCTEDLVPVMEYPDRTYILKKDAASDKGVAGAVYSVMDKTADRTFEITSDKDGYMWLVLIPEHKYTVQEIRAPEGYELDSSIYSFTVDKNGKSDLDLVFKDKKIGTVEIVKTDVITGEPVPGASITVYSMGNEPLFSQKTDERGRIYFDASPYMTGSSSTVTFKYKETATPGGYYLNPDIYAFNVTPEGKVTGTVSFADIPVGTVAIKKVDENGATLPGARISIYSSNGTLAGQATTGQTGRIYFQPSSPGSYYFVEDAAPAGYTRDGTRHSFSITAAGEISGNVVLKNTRNPSGATGDNHRMTAAAIGSAVLISSAAGCCIFNKRKKEKSGKVSKSR